LTRKLRVTSTGVTGGKFCSNSKFSPNITRLASLPPSRSLKLGTINNISTINNHTNFQLANITRSVAIIAETLSAFISFIGDKQLGSELDLYTVTDIIWFV
jgi:hypothetical protein